MNKKTFLTFVLPALPILCLGVTLLVFIFSLEYDSYLTTFAQPTTTLTATSSPTPTPSPNSTVSSGINITSLPGTATSAVQQPTAVPATPTPDPAIEKERERFLSVFKDIALVIAASIITFSSSYIGGLIQSVLQKEQENRQERRTQAIRYKEYLEWILRTGQRKLLLIRHPILKQLLPHQGKAFDVDEITMQKVINDMPLALGLRALEDGNLQKEFDEFLIEAIGYLIEIARGQTPNEKTLETINVSYNKIINSLNLYAEEGKSEGSKR